MMAYISVIFFLKVVLTISQTYSVYVPAENDTRFVVQVHHAREGHFPYQISLRDKKTYEHFCSGAILNRHWTVSVAHCTYKRKITTFKVIVGSTNIFAGSDYEVSEIVIHPRFLANTCENDIALLKTQYDIQYSKTVDPIPIQTIYSDKPVGGDVSGWTLYLDHGPITFRLQYVYLKTITAQACKSMHYPHHIFRTTLCAASKHHLGVCMSDPGAPLVVDKKLIGLVTWTSPCDFGEPHVFTRVSEYKDWIKKQIAHN